MARLKTAQNQGFLDILIGFGSHNLPHSVFSPKYSRGKLYDMENSEESISEIDIPENLLPDLEVWGIEEVSRGVCADTFENRRILRENKCRWQPVANPDGTVSGYIIALSPELQTARLAASDRGTILANRYDPNGEYVTGHDLLAISEVKDYVPAWVLAATRLWNKTERDREDSGKNVNAYLAGPPARCRAVKLDGNRCKSWSNGTAAVDGFCRTHLTSRVGETGESVKIRARNRLDYASIHAVDKLESLMDATSEQVALSASNSILDRAGIRGGVEIEGSVQFEVKPAADVVRDRLEELAKGRRNREALESSIRAAAEAGLSQDEYEDKMAREREGEEVELENRVEEE